MKNIYYLTLNEPDLVCSFHDPDEGDHYSTYRIQALKKQGINYRETKEYADAKFAYEQNLLKSKIRKLENALEKAKKDFEEESYRLRRGIINNRCDHY